MPWKTRLEGNGISVFLGLWPSGQGQWHIQT